jgi:hypothetical protein
MNITRRNTSYKYSPSTLIFHVQSYMFQETKQMKFHSTEINPNHQTVTLTFRLNLQ